MPADPTPFTVMQLFSDSFNFCFFFPKCAQRLIDIETGNVLGKICHIKGKSPDSPRYDAGQSDEERRSIGNLLLLCPAHLDVVNADSQTYTTDLLFGLKEKYYSKSPTIQPDLAIEQAIAFIMDVPGAVPHGGFVLSANEDGGQANPRIIPRRPRARRISLGAATQLARRSKAFVALEEVEAFWVDDDIEAIQFGSQLVGALQGASWLIRGMGRWFSTPSVMGLTVEYPEKTARVTALLDWLNGLGFCPKANHAPSLECVRILVGTLV